MSPADFGGYFPFSTRYSLDLHVLFERYGLNKIWKDSYDEIKGVEWPGTGAWDPCHIFTKDLIRSLKDLKGKKVFVVPTAGRFLSCYGLMPITVPRVMGIIHRIMSHKPSRRLIITFRL